MLVEEASRASTSLLKNASPRERADAGIEAFVLIVTEDIDTKLANDKLQRVTGNAPQARRMRDYHNTPWSENPERLAAHLDRLAF